MILLGIETSTARSSVALLVDGTVAAHEQHEDPRGHGAFLAPAIHRCLDAAPVHDGAARVDAVAVGAGPGLYTGLRVGMATGGAFATARGLPIVGVGGMDALAHAEARDRAGAGGGAEALVTTIDARRGQVFWAVHRLEPAGGAVRVDGPRVGTRDELDAACAVLAEDGVVRVVGEVAGERLQRPDAADTARLALPVLETTPHGELVAERLTPVYLRDADVRIGWNERGGVRVGDDGPGGGPDGAA